MVSPSSTEPLLGPEAAAGSPLDNTPPGSHFVEMDSTARSPRARDSKNPNAITLSGLQHPLGETGEQLIRTDQLDALRPRLGHQLLGHTLLVDARLRRYLLYWFCCHVVDRVSHGLTPFGFQTSQFHRSADSSSLTAAMWAGPLLAGRRLDGVPGEADVAPGQVGIVVGAHACGVLAVGCAN